MFDHIQSGCIFIVLFMFCLCVSDKVTPHEGENASEVYKGFRRFADFLCALGIIFFPAMAILHFIAYLIDLF